MKQKKRELLDTMSAEIYEKQFKQFVSIGSKNYGRVEGPTLHIFLILIYRRSNSIKST